MNSTALCDIVCIIITNNNNNKQGTKKNIHDFVFTIHCSLHQIATLKIMSVVNVLKKLTGGVPLFGKSVYFLASTVCYKKTNVPQNCTFEVFEISQDL